MPTRATDTPGSGQHVFVRRHLAQQHGGEIRPLDHAVTHDYAALTFYTGGAASIEQAGRFRLRSGDVMVIPAGEPHRLTDADQPELWGVGFCPVCFIAEGNAELLEPFERVRAGASAVVTIPEERRPFLEGLFRELQGEVERGGKGTLAVQKSLLTLIVAEVARAAAWGQDALRFESVVSEALHFIERNCLGPLSLRDVAAAVRRSPAHLTTAVRRETGRSVQAWIIAGRLSEARRRLAHTDEVVEVIAERVGYADVTHFIRVFRREHGVTPAAFRNRHRRGRP
jgi:AraC-like DNA-binding protein